MIDPSANATRQLVDPNLAHRSPLTARRPPQEVLAASTRSVYAVLDAQKDVCPELRDLGRDRAPKRVASSFEALMPDRPDPAGFCGRKEYQLVFCNRVARGGAAGSFLSCEQRHPSILGRGPSALRPSAEHPISHNFALGCDEGVPVRSLKTIIRRVDGKREAILPRASFRNAALTVQQTNCGVALRDVSWLNEAADQPPCWRRRSYGQPGCE